ncbi:hypothetical protein AAE478_002179 [Parahypoxylon ruwenzoriense]
MSTNTDPPRFTVFNDLPAELRNMIWSYALPDDSPEVCIPWPLEERPARPEQPEIGGSGSFSARWPAPLEPLLVDIGFPALMHVCRESREVAVSHTRFRYSAMAGCPVPFRAFRADLDILYMSVSRPPPDLNMIPRWSLYPAGTRHLAVDLHSIKDGSFLWILLTNPLMDVRTMACVLPVSNAFIDTAVRFRPPVRRCRLRDVHQPSDGSQSNIIFVDRGFDRRMTGTTHYLQEVRDHVAAEFAEILNVAALPDEYLRRWNALENKFEIEFPAQVFEEYRGGRWVPSSKHAVRFDYQSSSAVDATSRAQLESVKPYRVSKAERWTPLRDPEKFRVNDIQQDEVQIWHDIGDGPHS